MENQTPTPNSKAGQAMGIAALVLGITTIPFAMFPCTSAFSLVPAVLAIVFGAVGLNQAKKGNGSTGLPIAGLVLGLFCAAYATYWTVKIVNGAKEFASELQNDSTLFKFDSLIRQQMDSATMKQDSTAK